MHGWQAPSLPVSPMPLPTSQPPYLPTFLSSTRPIFQSSSLPSCTPFSSPSSYLPLALLPTFSPGLLRISANHPNPNPRTHLLKRISCDGPTVAHIMFKINQLFSILTTSYLCTSCCYQCSGFIAFFGLRAVIRVPLLVPYNII